MLITIVRIVSIIILSMDNYKLYIDHHKIGGPVYIVN